MLKNLKIAFYLVLAMNKIFYGIMKVDFIMEVGKLIQMVKVKNMGKEFSTYLENTNIKVPFNKEKDQDMEC
jgi:hypothetical protein